MQETINLQDIAKNATRNTLQDGCHHQDPPGDRKIDVYLAGPYTHKYSFVRKKRFKKLTSMAREIIKTGLCVFSPITHSHIIASGGKMTTEWDFWKDQDLIFIDCSRVLAIYKLPGYEKSKGVMEEFLYSTFKKKIPFILFSTIEEFKIQAVLIPELRDKIKL